MFLNVFQSWHGLCNKQSEDLHSRLGDNDMIKGMTMKSGKFENGLALIGVLVVLFAVTSAANSALSL